MITLAFWITFTFFMVIHACVYSILHLWQLRRGPRRWQGVLSVVFILAACALVARGAVIGFW